MSKTALVARAAAAAPRIFQIRTRAWKGLAIGVAVPRGLTVLAMVKGH